MLVARMLLRFEDDAPTCCPKSHAKIDILEIERIARVEAPDGLECCTTHDQAGADHPWNIGGVSYGDRAVVDSEQATGEQLRR